MKTIEDLNRITDFKEYEEFLKNCFICLSGVFYNKIKIKKNPMVYKYFSYVKSNKIKLKDFLEENGNHFVINFNKIKYANFTEFKLIFLLKEEIKSEKDYIPFEIYDEDDNLIYVERNDDINYWNCKGFEDEVYKKGD